MDVLCVNSLYEKNKAITMRKIKIILVAGARPNFMKIAPLVREMSKYNRFILKIIHTGQHYDWEMSQSFFEDLELSQPDYFLGIGPGTHAEQTARVILKFEKVLLEEKPNLVIVVGDVNSTLAASLTSAKLSIPVAHIEAGLRSFDRKMPEEINRIVTDALSEYLFTTCKEADRNLEREGIPKNKIFFVGNVMIDTLLKLRNKSEKSDILKKLSLRKKNYSVLTLHRPSNVDSIKTFKNIMRALKLISEHTLIVFSIHPRTKKQIEKFKLMDFFNVARCIGPLGYLDFLNLMKNSKFVLTDSGGIQEETTVLGIPCLTGKDFK